MSCDALAIISHDITGIDVTKLRIQLRPTRYFKTNTATNQFVETNDFVFFQVMRT